ncbi:hypothetical protein NLI96_g10180 [Meripilus lineatus]|uniref:Uncharacterized protein n=1 Tax=Meripilus lineatus TaxID=2056292 RepID=A0AAD5Y9I6_9APHY|nr:hypothetical protein NLI96_g10180 [Physisporinus lineatus]
MVASQRPLDDYPRYASEKPHHFSCRGRSLRRYEQAMDRGDALVYAFYDPSFGDHQSAEQSYCLLRSSAQY